MSWNCSIQFDIWHFQVLTHHRCHITGNPISATYSRSVYNPQLIFQGDQEKNDINLVQKFKLHCMQWHYFQTESSHHICIVLANYQQSNKSIIAPPKFNVNIFVKRVKLKRHKSADVCLCVSIDLIFPHNPETQKQLELGCWHLSIKITQGQIGCWIPNGNLS